MTAFQTWWRDIGSKIRPAQNEDHAEHAERVAFAAWNDSRSVSVKALRDIKKHCEITVRVGYELSTTWQIANKGLEEIE